MIPGDSAVKNSWGTIINQAMPLIEQVAAGNGPISLTGLSSYTLTVSNDAADQARQAMLPFIGSPTGPCTVTIPSVARIGWVSNSTNQNVIMTAGGSAKLTVPPLTSFLYTCDGANVSSVNLSPAGTLSAPNGVVIPNSTSYSSVDTGGVTRSLLTIFPDNTTNLLMGGAAAWRVLNQAGTVALLTIVPGGTAYFAAGLNVTGPLSVGGTLNVTGATTLANLTVSGVTTFNATQSTTAGFISNGYDAGGLNVRFVGGNYGSGWRNDGANTYLLLTNAGQQLGTWNGLRPFTLDNANGFVTIDQTGVGVAFGGNITLGGVAVFPNGGGPYGTDTGGNIHPMIMYNSFNTVTTFVGSNGWQIANADGTAGLLFVDAGGSITTGGNFSGAGVIVTNANITNSLSVGSINVTGAGGVSSPNGNFSGVGIVVTNANITNGLQVGGAGIVTSGVINANGGQNFSGTAYLDATGAHVGGFTVAVSIVTSVGIGAGGFYSSSDRRLKTDIADIPVTDAYDWIRRARPRTYQMQGRQGAGFVAQEEIDNGRGAAVSIIADDRPEFAQSDGYAPAGGRMVRRYEHDIAYLTAALQGALERIAALEARG
jgi:hypothetical protein